MRGERTRIGMAVAASPLGEGEEARGPGGRCSTSAWLLHRGSHPHPSPLPQGRGRKSGVSQERLTLARAASWPGWVRGRPLTPTLSPRRGIKTRLNIRGGGGARWWVGCPEDPSPNAADGFCLSPGEGLRRGCTFEVKRRFAGVLFGVSDDGRFVPRSTLSDD